MTTPSTGPSSSSGQPEPSLGALFATASRDLSTLVRSEIELAKAELAARPRSRRRRRWRCSGCRASSACSPWSCSRSRRLRPGRGSALDPAIAFLIVAVCYLLCRSCWYSSARRGARLQARPERTIRTSKDTAAFLKTRVGAPSRLTDAKSPDGGRPRRPMRTDRAAEQPPDASVARVAGPWEHRMVAANGARFHVAVAGDGPLVLFLHGFPEFWWAWRHQLVSPRGGRVPGGRHGPARLRCQRQATPRLRPDGPSRRTPRESSGRSASATRSSSGTARAGWSRGRRPSCTPTGTPAGAGVDAAPPRLRRAHLTDPRQLAASRQLARLPGAVAPERRLVADDAEALPAAARLGRTRLAGRDTRRATGRRRRSRASRTARWSPTAGVSARSRAPTAPLRPPDDQPGDGPDPAGARRPRRLRAAAQRAGLRRYVEAPYRLAPDGRCRHFPHEEDPAAFTAVLREWLRDPEPRSTTVSTAAPRTRPAGRARNARPRDGLGRPLPRGSEGRRAGPRRPRAAAAGVARRGAATARHRPTLPRARGARGHLEGRARRTSATCGRGSRSSPSG